MHSAAGRGLESLRLLVSDPDLPSPPSAARRRAPPLPRWVLGAWLGSLALALAACASTRVRIKLVPVLVDPATAQNDARWAGAAALVGIMAWTASATALLIAGHALRAAGRQRRARLLTAGGIVLVALALDDALLIHEYWVPRLTGAPDAATYLVLVVWVGVLAVRHRKALHWLPVVPLVMIGAAFAASLSLDVTFDAVHPLRGASAIEDVLKLWAVGLLALVCVREALAATAPAQSVPLSLEDPRVPTLDLTDHARPSAPAPAPEGLADSRR